MHVFVLLGDATCKQTKPYKGVFMYQSFFMCQLPTQKEYCRLFSRLSFLPPNCKPVFANTLPKKPVSLLIAAPGMLGGTAPLPLPKAAIVDGSDTAALALLKKGHTDTFTCGLSHCNTLCFSSLQTNGCVICLQRSVRTLQGEIIDPFELPLKGENFPSPFVLLSGCMAGILLGKQLF